MSNPLNSQTYLQTPTLQTPAIDFSEAGKLALAQVNSVLSEEKKQTTTTSLVSQTATSISLWQLVQYRSINNWLTEYSPPPNASNLKKIEGFLEASYHCCELEAWEAAWKIACTRLSCVGDRTLRSQMLLWGYYQELVELYIPLLERVPQLNEYIYQGLVNCYERLANYEETLKYSQKLLNLSEEQEKPSLKTFAFLTQGSIYRYTRKYQQAIRTYQKSLKISQEIKNRTYEALSLVGLGLVYSKISFTQAEINFFEQGLAIAQEIKDQQLEESILEFLGDSYFKFAGNASLKIGFWEITQNNYYQKAREYYQKSLELAINSQAYPCQIRLLESLLKIIGIERVKNKKTNCN